MNRLSNRFCCNLISALFLTLLLGLSSTSMAKPLRPFKAVFDVNVFSFKVGNAYHEMTCKKQHCLISSVAEPPKWAKRFINESAIEKIEINQSNGGFKWQRYTKYLTRRYDDRTEKKTYTLVVDEGKGQIDYLEKGKSWPLQENVYDMISMAYGIQHRILNKKTLDSIYLQDDKSQQKIRFTTQNEAEELDLPIGDELQTQRFEFHNDKIAAKLWLIPEMDYFPGRIEIDNKEQDRTIVLELNKLKHH